MLSFYNHSKPTFSIHTLFSRKKLICDLSGFILVPEKQFLCILHFSCQNFSVENSQVVSYLLEASDSLKKSSLKSNNHIKLLLSSPPCSLRFLPPTTSTAPWARNTEFSKEIQTTFFKGKKSISILKFLPEIIFLNAFLKKDYSDSP